MIPATLCVPLRRSRSWPPPTSIGANAGTAAGHQHSNALRAAELVRRQRQQIDVWRDGAEVEPTCGLNRVGVHDRVGRDASHDCRDLCHVVDGPDLVVDRHHADERRIREGLGESLEIDPAGLVDGDDAPVAGLDGVQHCVMLDRRAHRDAAGAIERAEDRGVVGLGAAAGEDDLARPAPDHVGDVVAGLVDRLAHLPGEAVRPRRVGELLGEERQHRLDSVGAHGRRRRVVEIDVAAIHGCKANGGHAH